MEQENHLVWTTEQGNGEVIWLECYLRFMYCFGNTSFSHCFKRAAEMSVELAVPLAEAVCSKANVAANGIYDTRTGNKSEKAAVVAAMMFVARRK